MDSQLMLDALIAANTCLVAVVAWFVRRLIAEWSRFKADAYRRFEEHSARFAEHGEAIAAVKTSLDFLRQAHLRRRS